MADGGAAESGTAEMDAIAARHGIGIEAVRHVREALVRGHGTMAQFDHPELGGSGQWSSGGMIMVGRMFDDALKAKVGALCADLAQLPLPPDGPSSPSSGWWPAGLGRPTTSGGQGRSRYAFFPEKRRLAVENDGTLEIFDTQDHDISGVSQQQSSHGSLRFTGRGGEVDLGKLERIGDRPTRPARSSGSEERSEAEPSRPEASADPVAGSGTTDAVAVLERLAHLHRQGVLTDAEFAAKKTELLGRV